MKVLSSMLLLVVLAWAGCENNTSDDPTDNLPNELPKIGLAVFSDPTNITNEFYGPNTGQTYIYKGQEIGDDSEELIRIEIRPETKVVMGLTCIIQHDVVSEEGIIREDTDDWLAQDDAGNLWYFGESVKNYDDVGDFLDDDGSWEAGIDEALPGFWMPASPEVGQIYYQEFYEDEAEDKAEVISLNETVTIALGIYENCLVTKDFNRFELNTYENKYYAPGIGLIKEEKFENNVLVEMVELIEILE